MSHLFPMNAKAAKDKFFSLMENDNYLAQEKIDGVRALIHINSVGAVTVTTRGASVDSPGVPIDITHRVPIVDTWEINKVMYSSIIDSEITIDGLDSSQIAGVISYKSRVEIPKSITFNAFDLLMVKNTNIMNRSQVERFGLLNRLSLYFPKEIQKLPVYAGSHDKNKLLQGLWDEGKEGIMLKHCSGLYMPDKRPTGIWYKVKKVDSVDAQITGAEAPERHYKDPKTNIVDLGRLTKPFSQGWFGALTYILEDGTTGTVAGLSDEKKIKMSDGQHGLKSGYVGMWMELKFMERTKDGNLRHPRFIRLREQVEK